MKRMIHRTFLLGNLYLLLVVSMGSCQKEGSKKTTGLLPAPQKIEFKEDISISTEKLKTICLVAEAGDKARFTADLLRDEISRLFNYSPELQYIHSYEDLSLPAVILGIPSDDPGFSDFCSGLPIPLEDNEESYVLDIKEDIIMISGGGEPGLFYGVQTLIQLMEEAQWENGSLQGMLIQDWPEMKHRMVHYNYFFHLDRYEYIKESIKKLAKYKVNGIVFEFEDQFQYQTHPVIAAPTAFTPGQVKELTLFAQKYHIDIIPLVQGFGHAAYILKHEEFKQLREDPEIYQSFCPLKEETYELIFDMFDETIEATPGVKYFHIGGDEVYVMGECPLCQEKKKEIGELGLYLTWLNRVNDFMEEHNRTIIFWDDMPLKKAGLYQSTYNEIPDEEFDSLWATGSARLDSVINLFPRDNVFMRWNYRLARDKGNISTLDWYKKHDFNRMIATAVIGNWPLIPDYDRMPENIWSFTTLGAEKDVPGVLCTAWGDDSGNHFEVYWMGFLATAEFAWSSGSPATVDRYWEKYIRRFFGPNTGGLVPAFHNLSGRVDFWNTALLKSGTKHRNHRSFQEKLISLPDVQNSPEEGSWAEHFESLMKSAGEEKQLCRDAAETMEENIDRVTGNTYNLQVFASMGRFMEAHCDLVLSIGEIAEYCDKARNAHKEDQEEEVVSNLDKMATAAESAWNRYTANYRDLEKLWETARYPKGGEGYVLNTQTNYLAGQTADLSYLILAEEKLDLPGYAEKLRQMADRYRKEGSFSF